MPAYRDSLNILRFIPENTVDTLYLLVGRSSRTNTDILEMAQTHFKNPDMGIDGIKIGAESIKTLHLDSKDYDPSDYSTYLVITKIA